MSNWNELTIDELKADKKNAIAMGPFGSNIKAENFVNEGVPIIKGGNLTTDFINEDKYDYLTEEKADKLKASNAFPLDIVITHRGTIGQVGLIPENSKYSRYVVSQSQLKVTLDQKKMNPYYLYYFFKSKIGQHRLLMNASQVGVPAIAQASTSVKKILVPHPKLDEQNKIVKVLLSLDDKIELNRKMNQTLEEMAQALFKSWFVDFDPVHARAKAKSEADLETLAKELGISKEVLELFPSEFEESELGLIPKGWEVALIGNKLDVLLGGTPSRQNDSYWTNGTVSWINSGMVNKFRITEESELITEEAVRRSSTKLLPMKTTVLAITGATLGQVSLLEIDSCANQSVIGLPETDELNHSFIYPCICYAIKDLMLHQTGGAQQHINKGNVENYQIVFPDKKILEKYVLAAKPLMNKISNNSFEIQSLQKTRDLLLPKLLSGELSVEGIETDE